MKVSVYISDTIAGWSSPVTRKAHNLEIAGSNPAPATVQFVAKVESLERVLGKPDQDARDNQSKDKQALN